MHSQVLYLAQSNSATNLEGQVSSSLENTSRMDTQHNANADNWGGKNTLYVSGPTCKNHICQRDSTVHPLFYNLQWKLQQIKISVSKFHLYVSQQRAALATGNSKLYKSANHCNIYCIFIEGSLSQWLSNIYEEEKLGRPSALDKWGTHLFKKFNIAKRHFKTPQVLLEKKMGQNKGILRT